MGDGGILFSQRTGAAELRRLARGEGGRVCQRVLMIANLLEGTEHEEAARLGGLSPSACPQAGRRLRHLQFFRQGWVVERVAAMAEKVFGCKPLVISLPYRQTLPSSSQAGFTMIIARCNQPIADAFVADQNFWLNTLPARNFGVDGFNVQPGTLPAAERADWQ